MVVGKRASALEQHRRRELPRLHNFQEKMKQMNAGFFPARSSRTGPVFLGQRVVPRFHTSTFVSECYVATEALVFAAKNSLRKP